MLNSELIPFWKPNSWPVVVNFHSVLDKIDRGDSFHRWNSTVSDTIKLIDYIYENFEIISENELIAAKAAKIELTGKFLITFDDGYRSITKFLRDYFKSKGIKPIVFLISSVYTDNYVPWYISLSLVLRRYSQKTIFWQSKSYNLSNWSEKLDLYESIETNSHRLTISKEKIIEELLAANELPPFQFDDLDEDMQFLSKSEVLELLDDGWSIGSHGVTHRPLAELGLEEIEAELKNSKTTLETQFGTIVRSVSYPNGSYDVRIIDCAQKYYEIGFINDLNPIRESHFCIPRIYDLKAYDVAIVPKSRIFISQKISEYTESSNKLDKLKALSSLAFHLLFSASKISKIEYSLIKNSINHYLAIRKNNKGDIGFRECSWVNLGESNLPSGSRLSISIICGPHYPERYAVAELSRLFRVKEVIVHNYARLKMRVFKGVGPFYNCKTLYPHLQFSSNSQKRILGHESLAWFVRNDTAVFETTNINEALVVNQLRASKPDVIVVFGTGIIRSEILEIPKPKINLHWGISPKYRGSYTLRWPILNRDAENLGVTIHELTASLDGGGIVKQGLIEIRGNESIEEIEYKGSVLGISLIAEALREYELSGKLLSTAQNLQSGRLYRSADYTSEVDRQLQHLLESGELFRLIEKTE